MAISRRSILTLGGLAIASAAAGCSQAVRNSGPRAAASSPALHPSATAASSDQASASSSPTSSPRQSVGPRGPAVEYLHGPRTRPQVALTFHGAGDPGIARDLLAIFAAHRAKVTVLAVGTWLAADHQIAHEILAGGHELGNHTYQHLDIDSLSASAAHEEIVRCRDLLVSIVGSPGVHFRQSQSRRATPLVRRLAGAAGYRICLSYDIDSLDYTDPGPAAIRANVAAAGPGSIVSMHFGHAGTVTAMPQVLADLDAHGLQAVTASTLLAP
ncbi:MAG: polysaccharide deacetylase family protein [Jatrophihabitans sp.]